MGLPRWSMKTLMRKLTRWRLIIYQLYSIEAAVILIKYSNLCTLYLDPPWQGLVLV